MKSIKEEAPMTRDRMLWGTCMVRCSRALKDRLKTEPGFSVSQSQLFGEGELWVVNLAAASLPSGPHPEQQIVIADNGRLYLKKSEMLFDD